MNEDKPTYDKSEKDIEEAKEALAKEGITVPSYLFDIDEQQTKQAWDRRDKQQAYEAQQAASYDPSAHQPQPPRPRMFTSFVEVPPSYGRAVSFTTDAASGQHTIKTDKGVKITFPDDFMVRTEVNTGEQLHTPPLDPAPIYGAFGQGTVTFDSDRVENAPAPISPPSIGPYIVNNFVYERLKRLGASDKSITPVDLLTLALGDIERNAAPLPGKTVAVTVDTIFEDCNKKLHMTTYGCGLDSVQEIGWRYMFTRLARKRWEGMIG